MTKRMEPARALQFVICIGLRSNDRPGCSEGTPCALESWDFAGGVIRKFGIISSKEKRLLRCETRTHPDMAAKPLISFNIVNILNIVIYLTE